MGPRLTEAIDRALPEREVPMSQAERERWGQEQPPRRPPMNLGMCAGVGKPTKIVKGVACCPVCGSPIAEGCRPTAVDA